MFETLAQLEERINGSTGIIVETRKSLRMVMVHSKSGLGASHVPAGASL